MKKMFKEVESIKTLKILGLIKNRGVLNDLKKNMAGENKDQSRI